MKKFLLFLFAIICVACMGAAAACAPSDGEFYRLVFRQTNGVHYDTDIPSGMEVRAGTEVKFSLTLDDNATGEPVVYVNDVELEPVDGTDRSYSFKIEKDTTVRVTGVDAPGEFNRILFNKTQGVSLEFDSKYTADDGSETALKNGMLVRRSTEVKFRVVLSDGFYCYPGNEPVVMANDTVLTPVDGVYTFVMNDPTEIKVEGVVKDLALTFMAGNNRVNYVGSGVGGGVKYYPTDEPLSYRTGDTVRFKVEVSVYYEQEGYEVQAGTTILTPDSDGYYTWELKEDTDISVNKLTLEPVYTEREDGGAGTLRNPFKISRPIDLWQFSALVNSDFYTQDIYRAGYYELANDIDMKGEQLFVIGNGQNSYAFFAGYFNGNNHKISNFRILDTIIDQENFNTQLLTSVGLFGFVQPLNGTVPTISNLTLENFTVTANSSQTSESYPMYVGGLVGTGYGVNIKNCELINGEFNITGGAQMPAYVGGIVGQQISAYSDSGVAVESVVSSSMTNVNINVNPSVNFVYATGGITGLLGVGNENVAAYVLNCYSTGNISGGLHAGGVVGYASEYTSVINSYASGTVSAYSPFNTGSSVNYNEEIYHSYAGGIVGYAGYESVVYGSFSTATVNATAARGTTYAHTDSKVGLCDGENDKNVVQYGYNAPVILNTEGKSAAEINEQYIKNTLHWSEQDWRMGDNGMPAINKDGLSAERSVTVTFNADSSFGTAPQARTLKDYKSMAAWSREKTNNIPEFVDGQSGYRSYGYFFDAQHKQRVPHGFVPTSNITLYVGSADYSSVAGVYYLGQSIDDGAKITLNEDGTFEYRNGASSHSSIYTYDGTTLTLFQTVIGQLSDAELGDNTNIIAEYFSHYYNFGATIENNVITIKGGNVEEITAITDGNNTYSGEIIVLFTNEKPLKGLKAIDGLRYGDYYANNGSTRYSFYGNGTGCKTENITRTETVTEFTYSFDASGKITIKYAGNTTEEATYADNLIKTVNSTEVQPYDGFSGAWEAEFSIDRKYTFDGIDTWTYTSNSETKQGKYTVAEGTLTANDNSFTAKVNEDGFIEITLKDKTEPLTYYREGSFKGEWFYSGIINNTDSITLNINFQGIGEDGYGMATASYDSGAVYNLNYETEVIEDVSVITLYDNDFVFIELNYDKEGNVLNGKMGNRTMRFAVNDPIAGTWISDDETIQSVDFNGSGLYDLKGDNETGALAVRGSVLVNGRSRVAYTFDRSKLEGKFTYSKKEYKIAYDVDSKTIKVTADASEEISLQNLDEWFGRELKDAAGNRYVFDGRGRLEKGGKITYYTKGSSTQSQEYTYRVQPDGSIEATLNSDKYTIKVEEQSNHQVYMWQKEGAQDKTALYRNTPFTGSWIIGGLNGALEIGEVYADNAATGSYTLYNQTKKDNITFTYNPDGNNLTFTFEDNEIYYINAVSVGESYYLSFGPENSVSSGSNFTCIPTDEADDWKDDFYYIYNRETNRNIGRLVFDGLGGAENSSGSATYFGLNSDSGVNTDDVVATHIYSKSEFGYGEELYYKARILDNYVEYLLIPCKDEHSLDSYREVLYYLRDKDYTEDGDKMYGDHYYAVVYPDELYDNLICDSSNTNIWYFFDGVGGVTCYNSDSEEFIAKYDYEITVIDTEHFIHTLEFTDAEGDKHNVTLDQRSGDEHPENWRITMNN